jgi:Cu/Ag efflux pump CusA
MMWLVRVALERPYTFIVMAMLIAVLGIGSILTMPVDIFPAINIPVVTVVLQRDFAGRHVNPHRYTMRARIDHNGKRH